METKKIYQNPQGHKIINYVWNKYVDELEFLWQNTPENAIVRHKKNRKWYAVFLEVQKNKLGLDSDENVMIINLRFDKGEAGEFAASNELIYPGYHMNKRNWITIILDGSMPIDQILELLDHSYEITQ